MQDYLYWDQQTDHTADEQAFIRMVSARHLHVTHPGEIDNKPLLKSFDKYIRNETADEYAPEDLVCSSKIQEDVNYVLVNRRLWLFMSQCFEADYTIKRDRDLANSTCFRTAYRIHHENHLKVHILPSVDRLTADSLNELGRPKKIYYGHDTTFQMVKERLVRFLNRKTIQ